MEPIKKTIKIEKLNVSSSLKWVEYLEFIGSVKYESIEIISIQLSLIDPSDVVLESKLIQDGTVLEPDRVYLADYRRDFVFKGDYLEFFPTETEKFSFRRTERSMGVELWVNTNNPGFNKDHSFACTINAVCHPAKS